MWRAIGGECMNEIKLDPSKLLGFKIIVDGEAVKLRSPKIGVKGCTVADQAAPAARTGTLLAKIGTKSG